MQMDVQMELNHSLLQRSVQAPAQLSWTELVVVLLYITTTSPPLIQGC
jgi:hypothetical protein